MSPRDLWGSFQPTVLNCVLKCAQREVLEASLSQATTIISREEHLEVVGVCSKAVVTDPVCSYSKLFQVPVTCAQLFVCQSYLQSGLKKKRIPTGGARSGRSWWAILRGETGKGFDQASEELPSGLWQTLLQPGGGARWTGARLIWKVLLGPAW